jgi:hypothetical protein
MNFYIFIKSKTNSNDTFQQKQNSLRTLLKININTTATGSNKNEQVNNFLFYNTLISEFMNVSALYFRKYSVRQLL